MTLKIVTREALVRSVLNFACRVCMCSNIWAMGSVTDVLGENVDRADEVAAAAAQITDSATSAKAASVAKIPTFTWFGMSRP